MSDKILDDAAAAITAMQAQAASLLQNIDASLVAIRALERRVKAVVDEQAKDRRLWNPQPAPGGDVEYLQAALRRLHAAVEGEDASWLDKGAR